MSTTYSRPEYYDIAFSLGIAEEVDFYERVFREHVDQPVTHNLEPACGTGRLLREFAERGYTCLGYDVSREMLDYAHRKAGEVHLLRADMRTARFAPVFQAAINPINSIGYLVSDEDLLAHLRTTADALRPGGVYIVQLMCAPDVCDPSDEHTWICTRDRITVETTWRTVAHNSARKLKYEQSCMRVTTPEGTQTFEDEHRMRLWQYGDWRALIERSGVFRLAAIYSSGLQRLAVNTSVTSKMGNLYYVLKQEL